MLEGAVSRYVYTGEVCTLVLFIFFRGPKKCVEKSNLSESKRKEKLNGTCFSCIAHVSREL